MTELDYLQEALAKAVRKREAAETHLRYHKTQYEAALQNYEEAKGGLASAEKIEEAIAKLIF